MQTNIMKIGITKTNIMKSILGFITAMAIILMLPMTASAHCDTMDGPTVVDAKKAMEENNINYVLKWVQPDYEEEIKQVFELSMKVKDLSPETKEIAEKYFFSELIRVHRTGEGAPFTGLKPSGTPIDEKVQAADESIAVGNLSPMEGLIEEDKMPELEERFNNAMALKDFDVNDVEAGREYIEAYVKFFKFAEGEEDGHHAEAEATDTHGEETVSDDAQSEAETEEADETEETSESQKVAASEEKSSVNWIPWSLAGFFLVTTIISHVKLFKSKKK